MTLRTPASLGRARREFAAAIDREPNSAQARVGLAETILLSREYGGLPDAEAFPKARTAAAAAAALDPNLPAAHRDLAFIAFWFDRDLALARHEFQRALELGPDDAQTRHWYATALSANGEQSTAFAEIARARQLDPQSVSIAADYGLLCYYAGDHRQGLVQLYRIIRDRPDQLSAYAYLSQLLLSQGDVHGYLRTAGTVARLRHDGRGEREVTEEANAFERGGRHAWLVTRFANLREAAARGEPIFFQLATTAALHNDLDEAAAMLRKAEDRHEVAMASLAADPVLGHMLHDPRLMVFAPKQKLVF